MPSTQSTTSQTTVRPIPGAYSPRERLLRLLRHQKVDRLPIIPTGTSPFTWHAEFPAYAPVLEVAKKYCEFMANFSVPHGQSLCDPAILQMTTDKKQEGDRKTHTTTLKTPKGDLTEVRIHDPVVGAWATAKAFVNSEEDLAAMESLPFQLVRPDVSGIRAYQERIGDAGLSYCNGVSDALNTVTASMGEEFRIMFCYGERDRLRKLVERAQERLHQYISNLLDDGAGPVFRWYAIEPFVEPIQSPKFIDEFVVPFDREIVKLIHDRGGYVVTHCHGRLKAQIERMVQIGFDGVDCVESPPANDATLAEMLAKADGRLFLWGYVQFEDLAHQSGEQIEEQVRRAVEVGGREGRYVLGQAASPWMGELTATMQANWIRMIEAGVKYGW